MSSKAAAIFQSLRRRIAIVGAVLGLGVMASAGATMPDGRPTPTGLEVPRWISLKSDKVSARQGPGMDHRILWQYRARHLPVQVIAETREWRKICDPEGSVAWIHRTVASGVDISFVAPAHLGDRLTAHGHARQQGGRSGVYDIEVENQDGKLVALFRGRAARIKGHFFEMPDNPGSPEGR